jgi:hypothetical protein
VLVMQEGDVNITSRDPIPHSVHTHAQHNRDYNESMSPLQPDISLSFPRPDVISKPARIVARDNGSIDTKRN